MDTGVDAKRWPARERRCQADLVARVRLTNEGDPAWIAIEVMSF